jgi:23S rRNA (adenine2503-C2)-methyltransferase
MNNIFNYTRNSLEETFINLECKKYIASQVLDWLYKKHNYDIDSYSNISKENREFIKSHFSFETIKIEKVEEDKDVKKFLFSLIDNQKIEAVLMYHDYGLSLCVSSEVGCNMGCKFCESGRLKKIRNLETYEMVEQVLLISDYVQKRIDSVVIMGIGEPFDNYENIINFLRIINDDKLLAIGARHITVSTCGLVPKIKEYASFPLQVNLAISLHAPNDEIRKKIMPIASVYPMNELIDAIKYYTDKTGRRITIEYLLIKDLNDTVECAKQLASYLKDIKCNINLIPYNPTEKNDYQRPSNNSIMKFKYLMEHSGKKVTVRLERGADIDAACGQLRGKVN